VDDPELRRHHFLIVACYNVQHPAQFTDAAIDAIRSALIDALDHGVRVVDLRRRFAAQFVGTRRVLKDSAERMPVLRSWSMTIADVHLLDRPQGAADRVRAWAAAVREEM